MYRIRTILHATDFSEGSAVALRLACSLAQQHGARLVVVHVAEVPIVPYVGGLLLPESPTYLQDVKAKLLQVGATEAGLPVEHRLVEGEPASEIVSLAAEVGADLIVLGTHGRKGLARLFLGSVAEQVLRLAPCPVLTVKPPGPASLAEVAAPAEAVTA
jgi:nucleotide-binding universal stress UspA family protein